MNVSELVPFLAFVRSEFAQLHTDLISKAHNFDEMTRSFDFEQVTVKAN